MGPGVAGNQGYQVAGCTGEHWGPPVLDFRTDLTLCPITLAPWEYPKEGADMRCPLEGSRSLAGLPKAPLPVVLFALPKSL